MAKEDNNNGLLQGLNAFTAHGNKSETPPLPPFFKYPVLNGLWYNQKVIKLDGWNFEACRFDNCKLIIETPYFTVKNCYIDGSNSVEVQGVLMNAVKFLNMNLPMSTHPIYQPIKNPDGTVSIGA
ncbi:hypothetical protein ACEN2T_14975 [Pseudomonas sp. W22_MBD1_FP4]|uniref:hypothetical protein n=1 Tax=Pseudomonas sp. W22_MBD1_FP4 TaxID=3240272 RepID=UPI003F9A591C